MAIIMADSTLGCERIIWPGCRRQPLSLLRRGRCLIVALTGPSFTKRDPRLLCLELIKCLSLSDLLTLNWDDASVLSFEGLCFGHFVVNFLSRRAFLLPSSSVFFTAFTSSLVNYTWVHLRRRHIFQSVFQSHEMYSDSTFEKVD